MKTIIKLLIITILSIITLLISIPLCVWFFMLFGISVPYITMMWFLIYCQGIATIIGMVAAYHCTRNIKATLIVGCPFSKYFFAQELDKELNQQNAEYKVVDN